MKKALSWTMTVLGAVVCGFMASAAIMIVILLLATHIFGS